MSDLTQANTPNSTVTLLASAARTATASGAAVSGFAAASNLVMQLEVTAASGTLPTLDLIIQDTVDGTNYNTVQTFTQATGTTREIKRLQTPFTDTLRVTFVIGGTNPSFTFSVKVFADA